MDINLDIWWQLRRKRECFDLFGVFAVVIQVFSHLELQLHAAVIIARRKTGAATISFSFFGNFVLCFSTAFTLALGCPKNIKLFVPFGIFIDFFLNN